MAMYGPESPEFYGLIGTRTRAIYRRIECSPCMNVYDAKTFACPFNARCMEQIGVDEVVAASRQLLSPTVLHKDSIAGAHRASCRGGL